VNTGTGYDRFRRSVTLANVSQPTSDAFDVGAVTFHTERPTKHKSRLENLVDVDEPVLVPSV
jgi:hypothetical protein